MLIYTFKILFKKINKVQINRIYIKIKCNCNKINKVSNNYIIVNNNSKISLNMIDNHKFIKITIKINKNITK